MRCASSLLTERLLRWLIEPMKENLVMRRLLMYVAAALLATTTPVFAQGEQAGAIRGRLASADGLPLPGASVSVTSPALQGARSTAADINGVYVVAGLPPGVYEVRFELSGFQTEARRVTVPLGTTLVLDQQLPVATVSESVDVKAGPPAPVAAAAGAMNLRVSETQQLPVGRTPFLIAELSPGLTDNTPNQNQLTVGGGLAYDSLFLVDGVDVNDNVLAQPNGLFIEDGIEEVQVLSSGIGAEYGRFAGGVVNVVTKSGSNLFSGALRTNLSNASWSDETPREQALGVSRASKLSPTYEATVGGPILRNRLWFFGGTRIERSTTPGLFSQTNIPFTSSNHNTRYEAKVTATPVPGQTVQGSYIDNNSDLVQPALSAGIDPQTMTTPSTPNHLAVATWRGVVGRRAFATAQYSQKTWNLRNQGNTSTDILDSPFLTRGVLGVPGGLLYNAPYFDSTDPESRNNRQATASLSYLLGRRGIGSHELKTGFEYFVSTRQTGNSQTSTGYVFQSDYQVDANNHPALDANGRLIPRFVPGNTRMQTWMPVRGAVVDVGTESAFVTDRWTAGPRWTFDLGARFEHVGTDATLQTQPVSANTFMPRLGASYAVTSDGRTVAQATYGHYSGTYNGVQFSRNSAAGNADRLTGGYVGPAGEGRDFAPGFDPANYVVIGGSFPTVNVSFDSNLSSPVTRELTLSLARDFGHGLWARGRYVRRQATDFVEDFITIADGTTDVVKNGVDFGVFDNAVYRNSDLPKRNYDAIDLQSAWRQNGALSISGQWTVQLRNDGNFEGEAANNPAIPSIIGDYPELYVADRSFPMGHLDDFQRNKLRLWATYSVDLQHAGRLEFSPMYRYNSGRTFSYVAAAVPFTAAQRANDPGYAFAPTSQPIFFGDRGAGQFPGYALVDFATTWSVPVARSLKPWVKVEVLNALNNQKLTSWDTTVTADPNGPKDVNGLPLAYIKGHSFGQAARNSDYPRPRAGLDGGRTYFLSLGVRF
jgi:carboxypeptidase family protein